MGSSQVHLDVAEVAVGVRFRLRIVRVGDGRFGKFPQHLGVGLHPALRSGPREIRVQEFFQGGCIGLRQGQDERPVGLHHVCILAQRGRHAG